MKTLQLFVNGKEILGSDGILHVDGRLNMSSVKREVANRNKRYATNFPHLVCDSFAVYNGSIRNGYYTMVQL